MKTLFTGICTALPTPFTKDNTIDFDALRNMIDQQIDAGINALCILGTTGEAPTISFDEKIEIVKFSLYAVGNRVPIIFGIGGNNPPEIIRLGHAINAEVERSKARDIGVLLSTPYYNKCTQEGAVKHFKSIANEVKLPLIVYNIPSRTGMNLTPETISKIAHNGYVYGIKESSGNIEQIAEIVRLCPNKAVYCGDDMLSLPCYAIGCKGCVSVASNIRPQETIKIWNTKSADLYLGQLSFYRELFSSVNPIPLKSMLSKIGICENILRPPLTPQ